MTTHHGSAIRDVCECDCMRVSLMDDKEPHPSGARLSRRGGCECEVLWDGVGGGGSTVTINPNVRTNAPETLTNAPASSVASWNIHALVRHRNHRAPVAIKETRGSAAWRVPAGEETRRRFCETRSTHFAHLCQPVWYYFSTPVIIFPILSVLATAQYEAIRPEPISFLRESRFNNLQLSSRKF